MDGSIHYKNGGNTESCTMMHRFSLRFWCGYLHQPKNITCTTIPFYFDAFINANLDFDVSVANDVAIDVTKCALPGLSRLQLASANHVAALTSRDGILWVQCKPNVKNQSRESIENAYYRLNIIKNVGVINSL